jgi:hypothetical protein
MSQLLWRHSASSAERSSGDVKRQDTSIIPDSSRLQAVGTMAKSGSHLLIGLKDVEK